MASGRLLLASADRAFAQEGDTALRRFPQTVEEIRPVDGIVIGDVPQGYFNAEQMRLIYEHVSVGGAGLMFIAGTQDMPVSYAAGPLSPLLPIGNMPTLELLTPPVIFKPTSASQSLGVLRLRSAQTAQAGTDWPADLPPLLWAQAIHSLKPASEVLAVDESSTKPLIARMRFGAGQTMYLATDESWRWRKPWGELYMDQYWTQLMRLLARGRLENAADSQARASLVVSRRRATVGDTLTLDLTLRDPPLLERAPRTVELQALRTDSASAPVDEKLVLSPADKPGVFQATWSPRLPGRWELRATSDFIADLGLHRTVEVADADAEMRYPIANHALLGELAAQSKGEVILPPRLAELAAKVRNRARITPADISEPLTHSPLVFALLLLLLTAEWIGRKLLGLV